MKSKLFSNLRNWKHLLMCGFLLSVLVLVGVVAVYAYHDGVQLASVDGQGMAGIVNVHSLEQGTCVAERILGVVKKFFFSPRIGLKLFALALCVILVDGIYVFLTRSNQILPARLLETIVLPVKSCFSFFIKGGKIVFWLCFLSVLFIGLMKGVATVSSFFGQLTEVKRQYQEMVENEKRIKALKLAVKNLSSSQVVASFTIESANPETGKTVVLFSMQDKGGTRKMFEKRYSFDTNEIYVDAITVNYEYSEIAEGGKNNFAFPFRVYDANTAQKDAYRLVDDDDIPLFFHRTDADLIGIDEEAYWKAVKELNGYCKDPEQGRKAGFVISEKEVVTEKEVKGLGVGKKGVKTGEIYDVKIQNTGGLTFEYHDPKL